MSASAETWSSEWDGDGDTDAPAAPAGQVIVMEPRPREQGPPDAPRFTPDAAQVRRLAPIARRVLLGGVIALSATLQFYRLDDWQYFSDDQAAQLNVMHGLLADHHLPLLGMALSVGQAHIGPLFYYLLALPLWLGHLNPTAGVAMIGIFQLATVYLLYRLFALVEAPWAGLCASTLYATSGLVVYWSRFLWPNIAPFFVLLALYALLKLAQGKGLYLILLAGSLAATAQLQPTALLLIPVAALWLIALRPRLTPRLVLAALATAALLFAPVIYFDFTHGFAELRAWVSYATTLRPAGGHGLDVARGLGTLARLGRSALGLPENWAAALLAVTLLAMLAATLGMAGRRKALLARLLLLWGGVYLLAFSLYHGALHPHYVEPLYPLPFLGLGLAIDLAISITPRTALNSVRETFLAWLRGVRQTWATLRGVIGGVRRFARGAVAAARVLRPSRRALLRGLMILLIAALVVSMATINVRRLWADRFMLDASQLDTPAAAQSNEIGLGEMRQAAGLITRDARGQPYSFLLAVRDGAGAYLYVQRQQRNSPASGPRPLRYLLVEPSDRPAWLWPSRIRTYWRLSHGDFTLLPHLLLWRITPEYGRAARSGGPWRSSAALDGPVTALTALPGDGRHLLAGFIGGAALSTDGGRTWQPARWPRQAPNGLAMISSFAWSPACPRRLYAGTYDGIVASTDGGASWTRPAAQPESTEVLSLLADPRHCGVVYAGTRTGIARTSDGGRRWSLHAIDGARRLAVQTLAIDAHAHMIYAGTTDGVRISRDDGHFWSSYHQVGEPRPVLALLVHPFGTRHLLAGTGAGIATSGVGSRAWTHIGPGLTATVYTLLPLSNHGMLVAGTDAGLYLSHDGGAHWSRAALPDDLTASAFAMANDRLIYVATNQGVYRSADGGNAWIRP